MICLRLAREKPPGAKVPAAQAGAFALVFFGAPGSTRGVSFVSGRTAPCAALWDSVAGGYGGDDITVANAWQAGGWLHMGPTYDGTTARIYLNGRGELEPGPEPGSPRPAGERRRGR